MESILAWLAGAVAVGTAALFAPKKKRNVAPEAKSAAAQPASERSDVVIAMAQKKAQKQEKKATKQPTATKKIAAPAKSSAPKRKAVAKTKAKTPTAIRKPRKRKAS